MVALVHGGRRRAAGIGARAGSVRPKPPSTFPEARIRDEPARWSSVPKSMMGEVPSVVCAETVMACDASTLASSWTVRMYER